MHSDFSFTVSSHLPVLGQVNDTGCPGNDLQSCDSQGTASLHPHEAYPECYTAFFFLFSSV